MYVRGGADKSLARPGRKRATVTKLGIYSTCSPRSSIHFLVHCSTFASHSKKIQNVVHPTRSLWQQWPTRRTKNGDLSIVFSVQRTGGSPTGPDPENGWVIKTMEARVASFFWVASARWARALLCKNKTSLVTFPWRFSFKMSFSCTSRDE